MAISNCKYLLEYKCYFSSVWIDTVQNSVQYVCMYNISFSVKFQDGYIFLFCLASTVVLATVW